MSSLVAGSVAMTVLVLVAGPAAASGSPADKYSVLNATVNAATDHEIAGSSAFPNYATGAVDNYYSMAHSSLDSSPSAEGTASPVDTGPIGQTVAAGNFAQPQYADARWPGNSGKATFGSQGGPYATADASSYKATASASEASNGSSASSKSARTSRSGKAGKLGKTRRIAGPKGFSRRLRRALRVWKARWLPRLHLKISAARIPASAGTPTPSLTTPTLTSPSVTVPSVTTTVATTPSLTTPTVTVPKVTTTPVTKPKVTTPRAKGSRTGSGSSSGNGGGLLQSSTQAVLDPGSGALVTTGESSLGHVSIGGGQIVLDGIHVSATVTNSGTPTDKVAVDIGAASVGGVPVTIDQTGVHVNGQGAGLPFKQADDALNTALKQAGIQLFTVAPETQKLPNEEQLTATGVHVKFAQPVDAPGVPAQFVEHILGEVFIDSLAVPGVPFSNFNLGLSGSGSSSLPGGGTSSGGSSTGLVSTGAGGSSAGGFPSSVGSGSSSSGSSPYQTTSSSTSGSSPQTIPGRLIAWAASKPLWLLIGYLVWQALLLGTGVSLRYWRPGGVG